MPTIQECLENAGGQSGGKHWGASEGEQRAKYRGKVEDLMHGVCAAQHECGGALLSQLPSRWGDSISGAAFEQGCRQFYEANPTKIGDLTFIAAGPPGPNGIADGIADLSYWHGFAQKHNLTPKQRRTHLCFPFDTPVDLASAELAKPLGTPVQKHLVYPAVPWEKTVVWPKDCLACQMGWGEPGKHHDNLGRCCLNPFITHLLVGGKESFEALNVMQAIFPSVFTVIDFKTARSIRSAFATASRGSTVILMQNMGVYVNMLAASLEEVRKKKRQGNENASDDSNIVVPFKKDGNAFHTVMIPDGTDMSKFIVFDALHASSNTIIDKLTKALTVMAGGDMNELGFAQHEKERLKFAWKLHLKLQYNAISFHRRGRCLHLTIVFVSLAITFVAVMASAFGLTDRDGRGSGVGGIHLTSHIPVSDSTASAFAVASAVLPLVATFLFSVASRYNYDQKYGVIMSAAVRMLGEIYRYRTRSGLYQPRTNNQQLDEILMDPGYEDEPRSARQSTSSRQIFSDCCTDVYHGAMSAVSTDHLSDAPFSYQDKITRAMNSTCPSRRSKAAGRWIHPLLEVGDETGEESVFPSLKLEVLVDDGMSILTAEDYVPVRVMANINRIEASLPLLNFQFSCCQILLYTSTLASGILGLLGLKLYIPITAAFASAVESIASYERFRDRLMAANGALADLNSLMLWYKSLSMVERRLTHNKSHLVDVTEAALLNELAVINRAGTNQPVQEEDEGKSSKSDKNMQSQSPKKAR
jgi:hypothetical protein